MDRKNLFLRLYRWCRRQDENYHTGALACVVDIIRRHEPEVFDQFVDWFTDGSVSFANPGEVRVVSQYAVGDSIADLALVGLDYLVVVEVKVSDNLAPDQVRGYHQNLEQQEKPWTLVLVVKEWTPFEDWMEPSTLHRWTELGEIVKECRSDCEDSAVIFLLDEFINFLEVRGMARKKITEALGPGLQDAWQMYQLLLDSLRAAGADMSGRRVNIHQSSEWSGFMLPDHGANVGFYFSDPTTLVFYRRKGDDDPLSLDLEAAGFFGEDAAGQEKIIAQWISDCMTEIRHDG